MDLKTLPDLAKLVDLCRKKGVEFVKFSDQGFEVKLSPEAPPSNYKKKKHSKAEVPLEEVIDPIYSEEDILNWSVRPEGAN